MLLLSEFEFPKVLMWRTNFDTRCYRDVLLQHSRRTTPDPPPHLGDIYPRVPHLHHPQPSDIQVREELSSLQTMGIYCFRTYWH